MKATTRGPRASHVNTGTSIPHAELAWPEQAGRVCRLPKTHIEVDERSEVTPYGGLGLFSALAKRLRIAECIDERVKVLKVHRPFHESDHVLAMAANLFVGGMCLEDQASLQHSEAVRRILGAARIPDPTTAGDFLRRFDEHVNVGSLAALRAAIDTVGERAARATARRRKKLATATVDFDGHFKRVYGAQKEGADFNYKCQWSHHPLVASLAETGECLAIVNRPGNARSSDGAAEVADHILPFVRQRAARVLVRGDSDFDRQDLRDICKKHGAYVALVGRAQTGRPEIARSIPEHAYRVFHPRAQREKRAREHERRPRHRRRRGNLRRQRAAERNYKELRQVIQQIAEVTYTPPGSAFTYRLIVRRQVIEHREGQQHLVDQYRYRYVITDLPGRAEDVVDETYLRCDQENVIQQLGSGLAAWRMPVGEFAGNSAWLEIARLAWNIGKWIALLALPDETSRWEWKRFRAAFVIVAAQVLVRSRQVSIRISASHRWHPEFVAAHQRLQM